MHEILAGERRRGSALAVVVLVIVVVIGLTALSLNMSRTQAVAQSSRRLILSARQTAESGGAQALATLTHGGRSTPASGGGVSPVWTDFSVGEFYYYTQFDAETNVSVVRSWGRVPEEDGISGGTASPDSIGFDPTGFVVQGVEITVHSSRYIPESPLYFGNGAVERPLGGFAWTGDSDPSDPSSWGIVTSDPSSYQSASVPMVVSALDHPYDYIQNGGVPEPPLATPHPYGIWTAQNAIGQHNIDAWFGNSAGGNDATVNVSPAPTGAYYDAGDSASPDFPYPVDSSVPDVQTFAWELWDTYRNNLSVNKLGQGSHRGEYGTLTNPNVTFVTGKLTVPAGETFKGTGILVIRDNYDPVTQTNNTPTVKADLEVRGKFEWTGLVIVSGWAPTIDIRSDAGAEATIVGSLFGEDSVQSGGEISLDSATIILRVANPFRVLYSNQLFRPGGLVHDFLPLVNKSVVGVRPIGIGPQPTLLEEGLVEISE